MKLEKLENILRRRILRIPDYQRGYAWKETHVEALWNDIQNIKGERLHFMGIITLQSVNQNNFYHIEKEIAETKCKVVNKEDEIFISVDDIEYKLNYIVDGQQRLTTMMILLKTICEKFEELKKQKQANKIEETFLTFNEHNPPIIYRFGYVANMPCYSWYKGNILGDDSFINQEAQTVYTRSLTEAKKYFKKVIREFAEGKLLELVSRIINNCCFYAYELDKVLDVSMVFETTNNRGKSLSNLEILKNRLLYLVQVKSLSNADCNLHYLINETWRIIYEKLGRGKSMLDDDEFLRNHWIMYFDHGISKPYRDYKKLSQDLFDKQFSLHNETITGKKLQDYCLSLSKSAGLWECYQNIDFKNIWDQKIMSWIKKLHRIPYGYGNFFGPLILAAFIRYYNEEDVADLQKILEAIERHNFKVFLISSHNSNQNKVHFYRKASKLHSRTLSWNDIVDDINNKAKDTFRIEVFKTTITRLNGVNYFAGWKGLFYFLYEYEFKLDPHFDKDVKNLFIQKIYVDSTKTDWGKTFKTDSNGKEFSDKAREKLMNSLGNFVLTAYATNEWNNFSFEERKKSSFYKGQNIGLLYGLQNEKEIAANEIWTPIKIFNRGKELLDFMKERWDIEINERTKEEVLLPEMGKEL